MPTDELCRPGAGASVAQPVEEGGMRELRNKPNLEAVNPGTPSWATRVLVTGHAFTRKRDWTARRTRSRAERSCSREKGDARGMGLAFQNIGPAPAEVPAERSALSALSDHLACEFGHRSLEAAFAITPPLTFLRRPPQTATSGGSGRVTQWRPRKLASGIRLRGTVTLLFLTVTRIAAAPAARAET
jgi:hypothetical protein